MTSWIRFVSHATRHVAKAFNSGYGNSCVIEVRLHLRPAHFGKSGNIGWNRLILFWRLVCQSIRLILNHLCVIIHYCLKYKKLWLHTYFFLFFFRIGHHGVYFGWFRRWKYIKWAAGGWGAFLVFASSHSFVVSRLVWLLGLVCRKCLYFYFYQLVEYGRGSWRKTWEKLLFLTNGVT